MTSARLALVPVRIPLAGSSGLLLACSAVAAAERRSGVTLGATLGNSDIERASPVAAPSVTPATTATPRQRAEPRRAAGISRVPLDSRPHLNRAGVFVGTHECAGGGQPPLPGASWISRQLVTLGHHQQFQRL